MWHDTRVHVPTYFLLGSLRMTPPAFIAALNDWTYGRVKRNKCEAWLKMEGGKKLLNSPWCCMYSQHQSGTSKESPCTPSWWCQPADIDAPAPHQQPDMLPHRWWKPAPSSLPIPGLNRKAPGQENCWRTLAPSHGAACEKTPTWKERGRNPMWEKEIQWTGDFFKIITSFV